MIKLRNGVWHIDLPNTGGVPARIRKSTGFTADQRKQAQVEHSRIEVAIAEGHYSKATSAARTLKDAYEATRKQSWARAASLSDIENNYKSVCQHIAETTPLDTITTEQVDAMIGKLLATGLSPKTVNRKVAVLSKLMHDALDWGWIDRIPKMRRQKETKGRMRIISTQEEATVLSLLSTCPLPHADTFRAFVATLVDTGLRVSEALDLLPQDIGPESLQVIKSKSGRARIVPLTSRVRDILSTRAPAPNGRVFGGLTPDICAHLWAYVRGRMGLTKDAEFVMHSLRHTCATRLIMAGENVRSVQLILGHSDIATTMIYVNLSAKDLIAAVRRAESVTRNVTDVPESDAHSRIISPSVRGLSH